MKILPIHIGKAAKRPEVVDKNDEEVNAASFINAKDEVSGYPYDQSSYMMRLHKLLLYDG